MGQAAADLDRWIPRLLALWRSLRAGGGRGRAPAGPRAGGGRDHPHRQARGPGAQRRHGGERLPPDRLTPDELREVAAAVTRLSLGLTRDRELAGARYLDDPRLLGAYLLFYWPVSYLQARGVLSELPRRPGDVLDLGSGPGPMAFAALDAGAAEVMAADRSTGAWPRPVALAQAAGEPLATRAWDPERPGALAQARRRAHVRRRHLGSRAERALPGGRGRGGGPAPRLLRARRSTSLAPGGSLVVIEPALRETSRALLAVRDLLVARGVAVRAPCLFRGACPALLRESDWCHAERPVEPPPLVAEIGPGRGLRKEAVKMSYLVLAPPGEGWAEPPPGHVFRIVSEPLPSKGRLRYMGCGPEGRMGLALQERHVTTAEPRLRGAPARGRGRARRRSSRAATASGSRPRVRCGCWPGPAEAVRATDAPATRLR